MTQEPDDNKSLDVRPELPPIRTIVVGHLELEKFQQSLMQQARTQVALKRQALDEADAGMAAAKAADEPEQYRRWRSRYMARRQPLMNAESYLSVLDSGYLPIPRIPALNLDHVRGAIPPEALQSLAEAKKSGLFDYFVVADGREATDYHQPVPARRHQNRDPIMIGVCAGQFFPIAWWR